MTPVNQPQIHTHPCGYCTRLKPCSCPYPAVSSDFICDECRDRWDRNRWDINTMPTTDRERVVTIEPTDLDTLMAVLVVLRQDQTSRSLADRYHAILEKVVKT